MHGSAFRRLVCRRGTAEAKPERRLVPRSALAAALAAVLAGIVTFLDQGGHAERHRKAAVDYKKALRKLEATAPPKEMKVRTLMHNPNHPISKFVDEMKTTLDDIDTYAPIPPRRIATRVESRNFSGVNE
jgi:hypothetical protein